MIKNLKRITILLIVFLMVLCLKNVYAATDTASAWDEFKNLETKNVTVLLGERFKVMDTQIFYYLKNSSTTTIEVTSSNSAVVNVDWNSALAQKEGTIDIKAKATNNGETLEKTVLKVVVKKTKDSTSIVKKQKNDVKDVIVSADNKKTQVLLANSELWTLDNKTSKLKKKADGNVAKVVNTAVYVEENNKIEKKEILLTLKNNNKLTLSHNNNTKSVSKVKEISENGVLTTDKKFKTFTVKNGKVVVNDVDKKVDSLVGEYFYIKGKKTYSSTGKKIFDCKIKEVVNYNDHRGYAIGEDGVLYYYYWTDNKITVEKKDKNVKEFVSRNYYKTKSGDIKSVDNQEKTTLKKFEIEYASIYANGFYQPFTLYSDKNLYYNGVKLLNNVESIGSDYSKVIIVRTDGSIWVVSQNDNLSLSKVRAGTADAKKISKPTNVKVKKSGTKNAKVSWKKVEGATKYTVYRAIKKNGKYTKIATTKSASYTDKKTVKKKTYYYKVVTNANNSKYDSNRSSAAKIKIK